VADWAAEEGIADQEIRQRLMDHADRAMAARVARFGADVFRQIEKAVLLQTLDHLWREHLLMLEHLRTVVGLRGYGQRDPLNEYKTEGFTLFESMLARLREAVTGQLMRAEIAQPQPTLELDEDDLRDLQEMHLDPVSGENEMELAELETVGGEPAREAAPAPVRSRASAGAINPADPRTWGKVPRNAPCPCGSGKKYKHCHGRVV